MIPNEPPAADLLERLGFEPEQEHGVHRHHAEGAWWKVALVFLLLFVVLMLVVPTGSVSPSP